MDCIDLVYAIIIERESECHTNGSKLKNWVKCEEKFWQSEKEISWHLFSWERNRISQFQTSRTWYSFDVLLIDRSISNSNNISSIKKLYDSLISLSLYIYLIRSLTVATKYQLSTVIISNLDILLTLFRKKINFQLAIS